MRRQTRRAWTPGRRDRLVSNHFRADGRPKVRYPDERAAHRAADAYGSVAYACDFCGGWHIGGVRHGRM